MIRRIMFHTSSTAPIILVFAVKDKIKYKPFGNDCLSNVAVLGVGGGVGALLMSGV